MNVWSPEWPTEEGWYWFTGYSGVGTMKLEVVRVRRTGNDRIMYLAGGRFLEHPTEGWWMRLEEPVPPPPWRQHA